MLHCWRQYRSRSSGGSVLSRSRPAHRWVSVLSPLNTGMQGVLLLYLAAPSWMESALDVFALVEFWSNVLLSAAVLLCPTGGAAAQSTGTCTDFGPCQVARSVRRHCRAAAAAAATAAAARRRSSSSRERLRRGRRRSSHPGGAGGCTV